MRASVRKAVQHGVPRVAISFKHTLAQFAAALWRVSAFLTCGGLCAFAIGLCEPVTHLALALAAGLWIARLPQGQKRLGRLGVGKHHLIYAMYVHDHLVEVHQNQNFRLSPTRHQIILVSSYSNIYAARLLA